MQPWPTAYTFLHRPGKESMRIIVNRVGWPSYRPKLDEGPPPGQVAFDKGEPNSSSLVVFCGRAPGWTTLQILELQPAGKKRMTAEEFLRGYPIVEGMRFGPEVLA
jgi:methionyl-tRNA formyltransferase